MRKQNFTLQIISGCVGLMMSFSTQGQDYVVKLKQGVSFKTTKQNIEAKSNLKVLDHHNTGKLILVDGFSKHEKLNNVVETLSNYTEIEYAIPNYSFHAFHTPNDPQFKDQWALKKVAATQAWEKQSGNESTIIAVIDTGIDWTHEDLKDRIWNNTEEIPGNSIDDDNNGYVDDTRGWDFFGKDNDPQDETGSVNPGHGTHCAGIIAASGDNNTGIVGLAPKVTLMPIRFLGANGSGNLMDAVKAIDYATTKGAQIISASWGAAVARAQAKPIIEAIERAKEQGVIFIAAAANDGKSNDTREVYPANAGLSNVISVAASNPGDTKPQWSNYGRSTVDLAAPGENILSTIPGNQYKQLSGTSMATPLVSGLVGLLLSEAAAKNQKFSPEQIKAIIQTTGKEVTIETACHCRIDAASALNHLSEDILTVMPNAATVEPEAELKFDAFGGSGPYTYKTTDPEIASITEDGQLKALKEGKTRVLVTDSQNNTSQSHDIFIGKAKSGPGNGSCPLKNPIFCDIICKITPNFPWCNTTKI